MDGTESEIIRKAKPAGLKRVFILGAGFSKPAGMPLANELLSQIVDKLELDEMRVWLDGFRKRLAWLSKKDKDSASFTLNIEDVFHYAHYDIEALRLRQQLEQVGREDGSSTARNQVELFEVRLSQLKEGLRDVIVEREERAVLSPVIRWARAINTDDAVLTFNYDTLVERALKQVGKDWNHGMGCDADKGVPIFKLHGSIDWIVAHCSEKFSKLDLLFGKPNFNCSKGITGHPEDALCLWRCRTPEQHREWMSGRHLQLIPVDTQPRTVGIAGLGAYKELHRIPGLGQVWTKGMQSLYKADVAVIVGFSMSNYDAMAQIQFVEVARARKEESRPLRVTVIDPSPNETTKKRYRHIFRYVEFVQQGHESIDWANLERT